LTSVATRSVILLARRRLLLLLLLLLLLRSWLSLVVLALWSSAHLSLLAKEWLLGWSHELALGHALHHVKRRGHHRVEATAKHRVHRTRRTHEGTRLLWHSAIELRRECLLLHVPVFSERLSIGAQLLLHHGVLLLESHDLLLLDEHADASVSSLAQRGQHLNIAPVCELHDILLHSKIGCFLSSFVVED